MWRYLGLVLIGWAATDVAGEPITIGQVEKLHSDVLQEERTWMVSLPSGYTTGAARYPVLYLLDAQSSFRHASATAHALAALDLMPPMIVVGVENGHRIRDLTTPWNAPDPPAGMMRVLDQAGGADRFLRFLTVELIPHVDQRYRTAPFRILVGHSFGGLFALHTLFTKPDAFNGYIALSPSVYWDGGGILREADAFLEQPVDSPKFLFLSLADEGEEMLGNYRRLVERLERSAPAKVFWSQRRLTEDDHGSAPLRGTQYGLEALFRGWRMPAELKKKGFAEVQRHYVRLSERYGFEIQVPEATANDLGYRALQAGDVAEAIRIFAHNVELHPESANAQDSLGEALEAGGQLERALEHYERAVARGRETGDPALPIFQEHRDALREVLSEARLPALSH